MTTPDATNHNPDPAYLRGLIDRAGISQREAARRLGVSPRMMRQYLADSDVKTAAPAPQAGYIKQRVMARWFYSPPILGCKCRT